MLELRPVARHIFTHLGEGTDLKRYTQQGGELWVDIAQIPSTPQVGVTTWTTIGMCNFDNHATVDSKKLRVELLGVAAFDSIEMGGILSTCAFNVGSGDYRIAPSRIFPRVIEPYLPTIRMKHILFVPPYLWENPPTDYDTDSAVITWLMAVPVDDNEFAYARNFGADALQSLLEAQNVDVYDLDRPSAVTEDSTDADPWSRK